MNKKGFTLVEILAVVAIIAVLSILLVPNIIENYKNSTNKAMQLQENETLDGAKLFVEDFCRNPISSKHKSLCNTYEKTSSSGFVYFCLSSLQNNISISGFSSDPYLPAVNYKGGVPCDGFVKFTKNGKSYDDGKTYLICKNYDENEIAYSTDGYNNYINEFKECKVDEKLRVLGYTPSLTPTAPTVPDPDDDFSWIDIPINPIGVTLETNFCRNTGSNGNLVGDLNNDSNVDQEDLFTILGSIIYVAKNEGKTVSYDNSYIKDQYVVDISGNSNYEKRKSFDFNQDNYIDSRDVIALINCLLSFLGDLPIVGPI